MIKDVIEDENTKMILKAAFIEILQYAYIDVKPRTELIIPALTKKIIL